MPGSRASARNTLAGAALVASACAAPGCTLSGDLCYLSVERCGETGGATSASAGSSATSASSGASGHGGDGGRRWPDSPSVFCTDGTAPVDPCPEPAAASYGQDGNYRIDVPVYDSNALRVVDPVTGLEWQHDVQPEMTTGDALAYCDGLTLAGSSDWHLPTMLELLSIVDYGRSSPSIDDASFPMTPTSCFKSSTPNSTRTAHWAVCFGDGTSYSPDDGEMASVRCVLGSLPPQAFQVDGETVLDPRTGLVWQEAGFWKDAAIENKTWLEALAYCREIAAAELGGYKDWRLPSIKELISLVDPTKSHPPIDLGAFPGTPSSVFWSSSPKPDAPTSAYVGNFQDGCVNQSPTEDRYAVRCVRGGSM